MNRKQALGKIRKAFENGELGFQKGATDCLYYCSETDSHCAVGVLIGKNESLMDIKGSIRYPFKDSREDSIGMAMRKENKKTFHGLTADELKKLQGYHDNIVNYKEDYEDNYTISILNDRIKSFKDYLYSL